jgi:peptidoglycan/LPS O-acetylase OafA/YrhL
VLLASSGVAMLYLEGTSDGPWRLVSYGVPAILFLVAGVLGRPGGEVGSWPMRLGVLLGDASYALYLVHPFPMRAFRELWARLHWTGMAGTLSFIAATLLFSCAVAVALHLWVEMPLTRAVRRWLRV